MGAHAYLSTENLARRVADTSEMHNASVDEVAARKGACAQVHLPTGRLCILPHGHKESCDFISADAAYASLPALRSDGRLGKVRLPQVTSSAWVRMDASGRIRFASRQAELLFGYDGEDLGGEPIETLIPEPVCKTYQEYWQNSCPDSRARARGLDLMRSARRQDGHWFPARINMSHVDTRHGLSVIAEVRDVTDEDEAGR